MRNPALRALLFTIGILCGCGGGGGGTNATLPSIVSVTSGGAGSSGATATPAASSTATPGASSGATSSPTNTQSTATIQIQIPTNGAGHGSVQSNVRLPQFVSAGTNGILVTVTNYVGGATVFTQAYDVSGGSSCSTASGFRTCLISMPLTTGDYNVNLKTYNEAPVAGSIPGGASLLGQATATNQTITTGQTTAIAFSLQGVINSISIVNSNGVALPYATFPADGASHTLALGIEAFDAGVNQITGSVAYATGITVTAGETGGTGHTSVLIDGVNKGSSGTLNSPADTAALSYDGLGSAGYGVTLTATAASASSSLTFSPMYLSPASASLTSLSTSTSTVVSEANPSGVTYNAALSGSCANVTLGTVTSSGSASSETLTIPTTVPGGTSETCVITISDNYGSSKPFVMNFSAAGPITTGAPGFTGSGSASDSGSCPSGLKFTAIGDAATLAITDPGGTGLGVSSAATSFATIGLSGTTATVTAVASGATSVNITDAQGNSFPCPVNITATNVQIQSGQRKR